MTWLAGFEHRRKFTIDNTKVDGALVNFPVAIPISVSAGLGATDITDIFDTVTYLNRKRIAITTADGVTQCYVEIENWDDNEEEALLHTKIPSVASGAGTDIYFYYGAKADNDVYVGEPGDTVAQNVWDSDFVGVWHMTDAGTLPDSTSNGNDGTGSGNVAVVDGKAGGKAIDFDAADDYIDCGSGASLDDVVIKTIEAIVRADGWGESSYGRILSKAAINNNGFNFYFDGINDHLAFVSKFGTDGGQWRTAYSTLSLSTWYGISISYDNALVGNIPKFYISGALSNTIIMTNPVGTVQTDASQNLLIGARTNAGTDREWDGLIGEVRISKIARTASWINATYHALFDTFGTWASTETENASELHEDLRNYTAVIDPSTTALNVGRDTVEVFGIQREDTTYLYKDYGAGNFGDFEIHFTAGIDDAGDKAQTTFCAISNTIGTINDILAVNDGVFVNTHNNGVSNQDIYLYDASNDNLDTHNVGAETFGPYYFIFKRVSTTATLQIYSDADHTQLIDTLSITCETGTKRYMYVAGSRETAGTVTVDSYQRDFRIVGKSLTPTWLSGFGARRKFTLDSALVDSDLTSFPVAIPLSSGAGTGATDLTDIFTELSYADRKKIAVTLVDGVTQCPVEIENWDNTGILAMLHAKILDVDSGTDTDIYLYYGSNQADNDLFVGEPGDARAQKVWDNSFVSVYHMTNAGTLPDSTVVGNDGTGVGDPTVVDGKVGGKAIDFDVVADHINCGSDATLDDIQLLTIESIFNADNYGDGNAGRVLDKTVSVNQGWTFFISAYIYFNKSATSGGSWRASSITANGTVWYYCAATHDDGSINNDPVFHVNGTKPSITELSTPSGSWISDASADMRIGARDPGDREFNGKIGEIRVSKIIRSDAWLKLTYYNLFDTVGAWGVKEVLSTTTTTTTTTYTITFTTTTSQTTTTTTIIVSAGLVHIVVKEAMRKVIKTSMLVNGSWRTVNDLFVLHNGSFRSVV